MKNATSILIHVRNKKLEKNVQKAQKIIISHISYYLGSVLWNMKLIDDEEYSCVPLPTLRDYNHILSEINEGELFIPESARDGLVLVGVPNIYIVKKDGKSMEAHRPEDLGKQSIPRVAYLVVSDNVFTDKSKKRFKNVDMAKLLRDVRAINFPTLFKQYIDFEIKNRSIQNKTYKDFLITDAKLHKKITEKIIRHNKNMGEIMSAKSKAPSALKIIMEEYFKNNRKTFTKRIIRLRERRLVL